MVCEWSGTRPWRCGSRRDRRHRRRGGTRPPACAPGWRLDPTRRRRRRASTARRARPATGTIDLLADDVKARLRRRDDGDPPRVGVRTRGRAGRPRVVAAADVEMARRVLDAAGHRSAAPRRPAVVSATVYGAWPTNPVPLTEDAPLRPDPGLAYAVQKAEVERLAAEWRDQHPGVRGRRAAPGDRGGRGHAPAGSAGRSGRPARSAARRRRPAGAVPPPRRPRRRHRPGPVRAARRRLQRGARRLAHGDELRALAGVARRLRLPALGGRTGWPTWRWRLRLGPDAARACSPTPAVTLGGRQRPAQGGRLGARPRQRRGLRRATGRTGWARSAPAAARSSRSAASRWAAGVAAGRVLVARRLLRTPLTPRRPAAAPSPRLSSRRRPARRDTGGDQWWWPARR